MSRPRVRDDVALMEGYHSPQVDVRVRLNTNEAPEPPPTAFVDALQAGLAGIAWHRYPDRSARALRSRIAEVESIELVDEIGGAFTADQVFAANGSNEVLQSICLAYTGAGRSVATFEPTYALHSHIARVCGATVVSAVRNPDFTLDVDAARELILAERPTVTFLCSPNNPTGLVEPESNVREVLALVQGLGGLLVVDEAYGQFAGWSALGLVDDDVPLVVSRTFSKTWSMAGSRLGYLVGPGWAVEDLEKVVLPYHLDAAKQIAGRLALTFADEMEQRVQTIVAERERLAAAMSAMPIDVFPSGANFILFRPTSMTGRHVWQGLLDRSVLIRDCSGWPRLADCLRVTVGTPAENDEFLTALSEVIA